MRWILTMIAILALGGRHPSVVQRDAPKPSSDTGGIAGIVVAADTHTPLADVFVTLRPADELPTLRPGIQSEVYKSVPAGSVRTDAAGKFALVGIPPGRYRIVAEPGPTAGKYVSTRFPDPALDDSAPIAVSANHVADGLVIPLPRGAVISGRIVDEAGNPIALVPVSAQELLPGERRRSGLTMSMGATTRTDDNGAFRLFGLRSGEFVLAAQSPRQNPLGIDPGAPAAVASLQSAYYPGTTVLGDATRIRIEDGDEYGPLTFTLPPVRLFTIRALVVDPNGEPATLVSVSLRSAVLFGPSVSMVSRTTNSDGAVEFPRVAAGDYALSVAHYGSNGALFAWSPITVVEDVDRLTIPLHPGVSVQGRLLFEGGVPAPLPTIHIRSTPVRPGGANPVTVLAGSDLSFTLADQYGPMLIRVDGPSGWYLKSVLVDGVDVTDSPVDFAGNGPLIEVVLTRSAATLSGTVTTAKGIPAESSVILINDELSGPARAGTVRKVMTSSDGNYRFDGLRTGRYLVVATIRDDGLMSASSTEYVDLLAGYATRVVITYGEAKRVDLTRAPLR